MLDRLSPNTRTLLRVAAGVAIAMAAGLATLILWFIGGITFTGCLIECGEPNVVGGGFLLAGAVLSASVTSTSVAWGAIGWKPSVLGRVAGVTALLAAAVALVYAVFG